MPQDKIAKLFRDIDIQLAFWILPVFRKLEDIDGWLAFAKSHSRANDVQLSAGFRLLLRVVLDEYLDHFPTSSFFHFTEDRGTARAFFVGLTREKFPDTSEMANIAKSLGALFEDAYRAKTIPSLKEKMETIERRFLSHLARSFDSHVEANRSYVSRFTKDELLTLVAGGDLVLCAHDFDRWVPLKVEDESLGPRSGREVKERTKLDFYFPGYKTALAFLWHELFGSAADGLIGSILSSLSWDELNALHRAAFEFGVERAKAEYGIDLGLSSLFKKVGRPDKTIFRALTTSSERPKLDLDDRIDEVLLHYQFELIDSARSKIFSGASTFTSLLTGEVIERRRHGVNDRVRVVRFKHPGSPVWFSYGILMERVGSFSDFGGWLLFLEIGGDYAGLGGFERKLVEEKLKELKRYIKVTGFEVSITDLRKYFLRRIRRQLMTPGGGASETDVMRFRVDDLEKLNRISLARLLEFVTKSFFEENGYHTDIYFNKKSVLDNRLEIDILAVDSHAREVVVSECSLNVPILKAGDFVKEINTKMAKVKASAEYSGYKTFVKVLVTDRRSLLGLSRDGDALKQFLDNGIRLFSVEDNVIRKLPHRFKRDELLALFQNARRRFRFNSRGP